MKFEYKQSCGLKSSELAKVAATLKDYSARLRGIARSKSYESPESSLCLPGDAKLFREVQALAKTKSSSALKYIVIVGIGGSNLGTKAVYDAIFGSFDILAPARNPKMLFAETCDSEWLLKLEKLLQTLKKDDEVLINIISKSGTTTETILNAEIIVAALQKKFHRAVSRLVITTDEGSKLWKFAETHNLNLLEIPAQVGGRYSVMSAVGLFPLAAGGIDISAFRQGALEMLARSLEHNLERNPALASAAVLYLQTKHYRTIHDSFFFHPELESLGKWYRQLLAESIGKEKDRDGKTVHVGITPTVSIGSTDLHSMGQLYLGGPKDKSTTFVTFKKSEFKSVPSKFDFLELVPDLRGRSPGFVMQAIYEGVKASYQKTGLPFMECQLLDASAKSLGAFLQMKMIEVMYLGELFNVNAFDQPNVELYKEQTRKFLRNA